MALALGGIAGAAIIQSHHDEKQKSQAEKDDPEGVEWICDWYGIFLTIGSRQIMNERTITRMTWSDSFSAN